MKKTIHVLFGILILMAAQTGSYAGITNGDFESNDLSGCKSVPVLPGTGMKPAPPRTGTRNTNLNLALLEPVPFS